MKAIYYYTNHITNKNTLQVQTIIELIEGTIIKTNDYYTTILADNDNQLYFAHNSNFKFL